MNELLCELVAALSPDFGRRCLQAALTIIPRFIKILEIFFRWYHNLYSSILDLYLSARAAGIHGMNRWGEFGSDEMPLSDKTVGDWNDSDRFGNK